MPWLKGGDNAATHPRLMRVAALPAADDSSLNEVFGWLVRCAMQSAAHMTDYVIDDGTARTFAGSPTRYEALTKQAKKVGLITPIRHEGQRAWKLLDDPEFLHIRLRAEVEWDRKRDQDRHNDDLVMEVLRRDGDACRYCGKSVNPRDRRGGRRRQFDHRGGRDEGTTPDNYVVACGPCNRARGDNPAALADQELPLRPAPRRPYYHPETLERLVDHFGQQVVNGPPPDAAAEKDLTRSRSQRDPAQQHRDPAASGTTPPAATPQPAGPRDQESARPGDEPDPAPHATPQPAGPRTTTSPRPERQRPDTDPAPSATATTTGPDPGSTSDPRGGTRVGSGRVGSVPQSPPERGGGPAEPSTDQPRRKRARRGRRSRGDR